MVSCLQQSQSGRQIFLGRYQPGPLIVINRIYYGPVSGSERMNLSKSWGYLLFFAIPAFLWLAGMIAVKRRPFAARLFAFVAGSDNRLSLSRLQAFVWTLVIFGSFAAAMSVHLPINVSTPAAIEQQMADTRASLQQADGALRAAEAKVATLSVIPEPSTVGAATVPSPAPPNSTPQSVLEGRPPIDTPNTTKALAVANKEREKAKKDKEAIQDAVYAAGSKWVEIPPELLALAAIAIVSGVFSSLISTLGSEAKTACVTGLKRVTVEELKTTTPSSNAPPDSSPLIIEGADFGGSGRVRVGSTTAPILFWASEGNKIAIDSSRLRAFQSLVVETAHGKLAYRVFWKHPVTSFGTSLCLLTISRICSETTKTLICSV